MKDDYLVIDKKVLPEIFQKVINTKKLIENGEVKKTIDVKAEKNN